MTREKPENVDFLLLHKEQKTFSIVASDKHYWH